MWCLSCLWYCKSTIFQANHNNEPKRWKRCYVVCDTAKVRFFKQITTRDGINTYPQQLFVILQKYDFSSKSQPRVSNTADNIVVCDTAKVRFFKQITTNVIICLMKTLLFVILQKYDFSSKSQLIRPAPSKKESCLWYCKSTIFQANHNQKFTRLQHRRVVCDTAKVRFFKQITTSGR